MSNYHSVYLSFFTSLFLMLSQPLGLYVTLSQSLGWLMMWSRLLALLENNVHDNHITPDDRYEAAAQQRHGAWPGRAQTSLITFLLAVFKLYNCDMNFPAYSILLDLKKKHCQ